MELAFPYEKKRSQFGRQCIFNDKGPDLIDSYPANRTLMLDYMHRDPVNMGVQFVSVQAEHELNTYRAEYQNGTMNHIEGGWPKDVNTADEEQTKRYRRKVEKEENYATIMGQLCKSMEDCILQNNAINIYQQYYTDVEPTPIVEPSSARTVNVFQDQCNIKRPISHLSWSQDGGKIAVTHCNMTYQAVIPPGATKCFIWELENPNVPQMVLIPPTQSVCLEYSNKDPNIMVSGQMTGQVAIWDIRRSTEPVDMSLMEVTHRDPVHSVLFIHSKTGTEFFSGSTDGTVKWWDYRKLKVPTETLIVDMVSRAEDQSISNAMGVSVLEYEPTIPTRFMIGTEYGYVVSGNRKGKAPMEKMIAKYNAHLGPVLALQRNAAFVKNFLTVGDWTARIWSEDCKESSILWTSNHKARLLDGAWSPTRYSVFFTCRSDGILDVWDILQCQERATIGVKVCDEPLSSMRCSEMGQLVCVANQKGTTYIVELSENLTFSNRNDKTLLTALFERENKREKILEARNRELRLKQKGKSQPNAAQADEKEADIFTDENVRAAEKEFFDIISPPPPEQDEEEEDHGGDVNDYDFPDDDPHEPEKKDK